MKQLEVIDTPYNRVEVWQNRAGRVDFEVAGATHATWHPEKVMTGHAWDALTAGVLSHPGSLERVLLLGLGGGTCLRQLREFLPAAEFTAVEIDPDMVRLAREYMDLDTLNIQVMEMDAYAFLDSSAGGFDVVMDDLYHARGDDVERPRPVSPDMIRRLLTLLTSQGTLAMNFVVGGLHDAVHQQACRSFQSHLPQVRRILPPHSHNEVLVGSLHPHPLRRPASLHRLEAHLAHAEDRELWKELRTLKLR